MGPFNQPAAWSTNGLVGARRFLEKVYNYVLDWIGSNQHQDDLGELIEPHVKKVTEDIDNFRFNTAVASLMSLFNELNEKVVFEVDKERKRFILDEQMKRVLCLLCPFAPHLVNELWELIGEKGFVEEQQWPEVQEELLIKSVVTIAVQVNGKLRGTIEVSPEAEEDEVKTAALGEDNVKKFIDGKEIQKVIFVKGKLLNIVAS
jgi:leucyl-tRNA synthetase